MLLRRRWLGRLAASLGAISMLGGLAAYAFINGWYVHRRTATELAALLRPAERIIRPDGAGPFPAVIQFHGCGGLHAADETWARFFRDQGFVAVIVDSLGPRHLPNEDRGVCAGWRLWGRERAGDVLVALDEVRRLPYVDKDRIFVIGWSHGGWSIMDLLALDPPHRLPTSLSAASGNLDGLAGVILIYPYLGFGALARSETIHKKVPILMLLSGADTVAPTDASLWVADRLRRDGLDVTTHVYEGRDHCWDQTDLPAGGKLVYDAGVTADAHARVAAFLARTRDGAE